jgi:hypothetical protein
VSDLSISPGSTHANAFVGPKALATSRIRQGAKVKFLSISVTRADKIIIFLSCLDFVLRPSIRAGVISKSTGMAPGKVVAKKDPRAWDALTPPLAQWILDGVSTMGFNRMTPVQAATLPHFLGNKDVVVEVGFSRFMRKTILSVRFKIALVLTPMDRL